MELFETFLIALQLTNVLARKKYRGVSSSSEESIENILYYKDCNHKRRNAEPTSLREVVPPPPKQQECKMCCTMCCGDNCNNQCADQATSRQGQMNPRNMVGSMPKPMPRQPDTPIQPPLKVRKKKFKQSLLPPIGGRRDLGFTRENIKTLIAQDEDIKKILKDLVKVTMQKVDLVEMINARNLVNESENIYDDSVNNEK